MYVKLLAPAEIVGPYIAAQFVGATIAAAFNYVIFRKGISALEATEGVIRGTPESAAIYDCAFGMLRNAKLVGIPGLLMAEAAMTAALLFSIFAISDAKSAVRISFADQSCDGPLTKGALSLIGLCLSSVPR